MPQICVSAMFSILHRRESDLKNTNRLPESAKCRHNSMMSLSDQGAGHGGVYLSRICRVCHQPMVSQRS